WAAPVAFPQTTTTAVHPRRRASTSRPRMPVLPLPLLPEATTTPASTPTALTSRRAPGWMTTAMLIPTLNWALPKPGRYHVHLRDTERERRVVEHHHHAACEFVQHVGDSSRSREWQPDRADVHCQLHGRHDHNVHPELQRLVHGADVLPERIGSR